MRSPLKAGPFRMETCEDIFGGTFWVLKRADIQFDSIELRPDEVHQLGRVVEKARKYRNTSKRLRAAREG